LLSRIIILCYVILEHILMQLEDCHAIGLSSWTVIDQDEIIGQEVMALTDQDGFIPGQIYYRAMPKLRNKHGEFITGLFTSICFFIRGEDFCD